jgi:hypothetical protein
LYFDTSARFRCTLHAQVIQCLLFRICIKPRKLIRHEVFIKTFKVSFRQTTLIERHHPTTGHPWHRLLRLYLLKCHLQLVIDGRRHLLRLRHRLLTLSSAFEVRCLDSLI